ncbi:hypothetical protein ANN_14513 [Periplaneta americana]|uniref:Uncharacterized protein n=1 Tax=Periplaneta americana TaxID=6978 RepID=A0ABQ8SWJ6_PERAM|nr:hypothetical protein ANN_14513 [Periplaneta americana]
MAGLCEGSNELAGSLKAISEEVNYALLIVIYGNSHLLIICNQQAPPAWLSRLRHLPAVLNLHSGAGSIPAWANYLVGVSSKVFPNRKVNARVHVPLLLRQPPQGSLNGPRRKSSPEKVCLGFRCRSYPSSLEYNPRRPVEGASSFGGPPVERSENQKK